MGNVEKQDMTHADTLRGMANGPHPGLAYSAVDALLAGAAALTALDRVRDALTKIDTAYQSASDRWEDDLSDTYASARADALSEAHHLIYEALGEEQS